MFVWSNLIWIQFKYDFVFPSHYRFEKLTKPFQAFLWISWIKVKKRYTPHLKTFGINLQYEVSICQILYNKGSITNISWYPLKCNILYLYNQFEQKQEVYRKEL